MFRLIKYAIFFFIGYRIIKMIFGEPVKHSLPDNDRPAGGIRINQSDLDKSPARPTPADEEYIEYEEVK